MTDVEIYERIVEELPFTTEEELEKISYCKRSSFAERLQTGHEILRRHWRKQGIDVDSFRMDKSVVKVVRRSSVSGLLQGKIQRANRRRYFDGDGG
jgi:hypothetical protein